MSSEPTETTLIAFVATYNNESDAEADFESLKEIEQKFDVVDGYDCAVVSKDSDGKVHINKTHETPTEAGATFGGGLGLATGLVAALFPAVALTGGLVLGATAGGAALGAITGHVSAGLSRGDLKDFGDQLDSGTAALIYIGAQDTGERVKEMMANADQVTSKPIGTDRGQALRDATSAASNVDVRDSSAATTDSGQDKAPASS